MSCSPVRRSRQAGTRESGVELHARLLVRCTFLSFLGRIGRKTSFASRSSVKHDIKSQTPRFQKQQRPTQQQTLLQQRQQHEQPSSSSSSSPPPPPPSIDLTEFERNCFNALDAFLTETRHQSNLLVTSKSLVVVYFEDVQLEGSDVTSPSSWQRPINLELEASERKVLDQKSVFQRSLSEQKPRLPPLSHLPSHSSVKKPTVEVGRSPHKLTDHHSSNLASATKHLHHYAEHMRHYQPTHDTNPSPTRKSPTSPSWSRYPRESPTRSPSSRSKSPNSANRFFENDTFPDDLERKDVLSSLSSSSEESLNDRKEAEMRNFERDEVGLVNSTNGDDDIYTYDLASFAASVHSSTKHLMSLNASPPDCNYEKFTQVLESSEKLLSECYFDHKALPKHLQNLSSTAQVKTSNQPLIQPKQQLPDDREEISNYAESQVTKNSNMHFSQTDDWSPIRDLLYPILDVSPSVEQKEEGAERKKNSESEKIEKSEKVIKSYENNLKNTKEKDNHNTEKQKPSLAKSSQALPQRNDRADNWSSDVMKRFPGQLTPVETDFDDENDKQIGHQKQALPSNNNDAVTSWFDKTSLFGNVDTSDERENDFLNSPIVFVNSDEDREIDLDEDIPPKPFMNRKSTKTNVPKQQEAEQSRLDLENFTINQQANDDKKIIDSKNNQFESQQQLHSSKSETSSNANLVKNANPSLPNTKQSSPNDTPTSAVKAKLSKHPPPPPPPPPKQRAISYEETHKYLKSKILEPVQLDEKTKTVSENENIAPSSVKNIIRTFETVQDNNKANIHKEESPSKRSPGRSSKATNNHSEQHSHIQPNECYNQEVEANISKPSDFSRRQISNENEKVKLPQKPNRDQIQGHKSSDEKSYQRNKSAYSAGDSYSPKKHIESRSSFHQHEDVKESSGSPRAALVMNANNFADNKKLQQSALRERPCLARSQESPKSQTALQRQLQMQPKQPHRQQQCHQQQNNQQQNNQQQPLKSQSEGVHSQQQTKNQSSKKFKRPINPKSTQVQPTSKSFQRAPPIPPHKSPSRRPPHNGSNPNLVETPYMQSPLEQGLRKRPQRLQANQRHLPPQPQISTSDHERANNRSGPVMHKRGAVSMHDLDDYSSSASPYHGHYPELSDYNFQQNFDPRQPNVSPAHRPHYSKKIPNSQSLTSLPVTTYETDYLNPRYDVAYNYAINNEHLNEKQEKLLKLQEEIEKRKYHLSELSKTQLQQYQQQQQLYDQLPSRWFTKPDSDEYGVRLYNDPEAYSISSPLSQHRIVDQQRQHQFVHNPENSRYMGLIKPIDYQIHPEDFLTDEDIISSQVSQVCPTIDPVHAHVYSSVEYLAHKSGESGQYQYLPPESKLVEQYLDRKATEINQQMRPIGRKMKGYVDQTPKRRSKSEYAGALNEPAYAPTTFKGSLGYLNALIPGTDPYIMQQRDQIIPDLPIDEYLDNRPGLCLDDLELSRQTFADILTLNKPFMTAEIYPELTMQQDNSIDDQVPARRERYMDDGMMEMRSYGGHLTRDDMTPAMTILDDVPSRTRNILRDIGSRPLSDDLEKYFQQTDGY
ncbi:hypothetical protein HELRODRAFT_159586 [Helobdella robusta]|uniref:Uncharacterized protein n=1 Tax=Helobdella robusta TaxID=6412 RepID=T1EP72_HELRO|nr:hypothetical protein HELRODRAFT_159586 [Helobdella robusta]ESO12992.1 hypothetical protein HELRODRAFT_159586 [Helobdella robusta]